MDYLPLNRCLVCALIQDFLFFSDYAIIKKKQKGANPDYVRNEKGAWERAVTEKYGHV